MFKKLKNKILLAKSIKKTTLVLSVLLLSTLIVGTTLAFVVVKSQTLVNIFNSGVQPVGNVRITKDVHHPLFGYRIPEMIPDGSGGMMPNPNLTFKFQVCLGDDYKNAEVAVDGQNRQTDAEGKLEITIQGEGFSVITGLKEGTNVTANEMGIGGQFISSYGGAATVVADTTQEISFVNAYRILSDLLMPEYTPGLAINGKKILEGREWKEGDSFNFNLQLYKNDSWQTVATDTVTYEVEPVDPNDPSNTATQPKADFDKFDFTEYFTDNGISGGILSLFKDYGTYSLRVTEAEDSTVCQYFDVTVGDNQMDGYLDIVKVTIGGQEVPLDSSYRYIVDINMVNKYVENSTKATVKIKKNIKDNAIVPEGFTFELYDSANALVATSQPTNAMGETEITLTYTEADVGTHTYTLKEVNSGRAGVIYDTTVHNVSVDVTKDGAGQLSAVVYKPLTGNSLTANGPDTSASAEPTETAEPSETAEPTETTEPTEPAVSTEPTETTEPTEPAVSTEPTETTEPTEPAVSTEPTETTEPTEPAVSTEPTGSPSEATEHIADLTITTAAVSSALDFVKTTGLAANSSPVLLNTNTTAQIGQQTEAVVFQFTNEYSPSPTAVTIKGTKHLENKAMQGGEFAFNLYAMENAFSAIPDNAVPLKTAVNTVNGAFGFELEFNKEGIYYYALTENNGGERVNGISCDPSEYRITVTVTDTNAGGVLENTVTVKTPQSSSYQQYNESLIVFTNVYTTDTLKLNLNGKKVLNGRDVKGGEFNFELWSADANYTETALLGTASNSINGDFYFEMEYTGAGTYHYVAKEVIPAGNTKGVGYDDSVCKICVTVTEDTTKGVFNGEINVVSEHENRFEFVNSYTAENVSAMFRGEKKLQNGNVADYDQQFKFNLYEATENSGTVVKGPLKESVTNAGASIEFSSITYTSKGTYYYIITEENTAIPDITYDDSEIAVKVVVTDEGEGYLAAAVEYIGVGNQGFTFTNGYKVTPQPTGSPTGSPQPTGSPTGSPQPTGSPTGSPQPTGSPTGSPQPTGSPTGSPQPTGSPTGSPQPSDAPDIGPSEGTSSNPTATPSVSDGVDTSDISNTLVYLVIMLVSAMAVVVILLLEKRNNKK